MTILCCIGLWFLTGSIMPLIILKMLANRDGVFIGDILFRGGSDYPDICLKLGILTAIGPITIIVFCHDIYSERKRIKREQINILNANKVFEYTRSIERSLKEDLSR